MKLKRINEAGLNIIKEYEGLRLESYLCPAKKWTIGYGHTKTTQPGMVITEDQADNLLMQDAIDAEDAVNKFVKVPISENQFSALVSFVFNVGAGNFKASTLLRKLNEKDFAGAADQFERWIYAKGQVLNGLIRRRKAEQKLFLIEDN
jgi:lysozyme